MGLLDWNEDEVDDEYFALPNYDIGIRYSATGRPTSSSNSSTSNNASSDRGSAATDNETRQSQVRLAKPTSQSSSVDSSIHGDHSVQWDPPSPTVKFGSTHRQPSSSHLLPASHVDKQHNPFPADRPAAQVSEQTSSTGRNGSRHRSGSKPNTRPHRRTLSSQSQLRPQRNRAKSFDLFHEDDELQNAEPRIQFCDICRKPCEKHK